MVLANRGSTRSGPTERRLRVVELRSIFQIRVRGYSHRWVESEIAQAHIPLNYRSAMTLVARLLRGPGARVSDAGEDQCAYCN
jgi:hypothetical protein